ncbi:hypothetical protein SNE25_12945 [Mucilaginibacter sabulilitoris]|uniref:Uncharacterized protein n=1 Tax=Mucilaginibacter sabulilitoris TaxID=1173583 RepID=A0ABZ0TVC6_9SPHI|nr:hypothetical protein [Mucilaginibacter sabulilitoris]WPU96427.1 hypothetical protein SNE25_12945 [Mucilaginibacter sabulilitoris]
MKAIAVFLAAGVLFLSSFSGLYQPVRGNCCSGMTHQGACGHGTEDCCNKGICGMMSSCSTCGFLIVQPTLVLPKISYVKQIPVAPYVMGDSLYHSDSGWHPPQV